MLRKIFKTGNSIVVSLPQEYLDALGAELGTEVQLELDRKNYRVILKPVNQAMEEAGINVEFAEQLDTFIEAYQPALENL